MNKVFTPRRFSHLRITCDVDLGFPEFIDDLRRSEALSDHLPPFLSF